MPKFLLRQQPIEAVQITQENYDALRELEKRARSGTFVVQYGDDGRLDLILHSPSGPSFAVTGGYLAIASTGQLHYWPEDIFTMVHEPAD